eukprot:gb/GEZN01001408.1/.p1 GENE.gb/GEZN01001408.1/~~gb/GEZN01001408.1/.p1  ORF type:complete len:928 (-),score=103.59 gb/GEZN01001408.1/:232-3015(-)
MSDFSLAGRDVMPCLLPLPGLTHTKEALVGCRSANEAGVSNNYCMRADILAVVSQQEQLIQLVSRSCPDHRYQQSPTSIAQPAAAASPHAVDWTAHHVTNASCSSCSPSPSVSPLPALSPGTPAFRALSVTIPLKPRPNFRQPRESASEQHTLVGMAVNGVAIVHGGNDNKPETMDDCMGHTDQFHSYHYHAPPTCLLASMNVSIPTDPAWWTYPNPQGYWPSYSPNPSPLIGWALDGFPLYGPYDWNGDLVTADRLDACHGLYLEGVYRYYLTPFPPFVPPCSFCAELSTPPSSSSFLLPPTACSQLASSDFSLPPLLLDYTAPSPSPISLAIYKCALSPVYASATFVSIDLRLLTLIVYVLVATFSLSRLMDLWQCGRKVRTSPIFHQHLAFLAIGCLRAFVQLAAISPFLNPPIAVMELCAAIPYLLVYNTFSNLILLWHRVISPWDRKIGRGKQNQKLHLQQLSFVLCGNAASVLRVCSFAMLVLIIIRGLAHYWFPHLYSTFNPIFSVSASVLYGVTALVFVEYAFRVKKSLDMAPNHPVPVGRYQKYFGSEPLQRRCLLLALAVCASFLGEAIMWMIAAFVALTPNQDFGLFMCFDSIGLLMALEVFRGPVMNRLKTFWAENDISKSMKNLHSQGSHTQLHGASGHGSHIDRDMPSANHTPNAHHAQLSMKLHHSQDSSGHGSLDGPSLHSVTGHRRAFSDDSILRTDIPNSFKRIEVKEDPESGSEGDISNPPSPQPDAHSRPSSASFVNRTSSNQSPHPSPRQSPRHVRTISASDVATDPSPLQSPEASPRHPPEGQFSVGGVASAVSPTKPKRKTHNRRHTLSPDFVPYASVRKENGSPGQFSRTFGAGTNGSHGASSNQHIGAGNIQFGTGSNQHKSHGSYGTSAGGGGAGGGGGGNPHQVVRDTPALAEEVDVKRP